MAVTSTTGEAAVGRRKTLRIAAGNLLLLGVACLGAGMAWAYRIFHTAYDHACQELLVEREAILLKNCRAKYEAQPQRGSAGQSSSAEPEEGAAAAQLRRLQDAVQRRARAECLQRYGPPPYVVELVLAVPRGGAELVLPVQLDRLRDAPAATDAFLQLVEYGLYVETSLGPDLTGGSGAAAPNLVGGDPSVAPSRVRARLLQSYVDLGYGSSAAPFVIDERTLVSDRLSPQTACSDPYSFGFASEGPAFTIIASEDGARDTSIQCIGKVHSSGYDTLERLRSLSGSEVALIIEVKIRGLEQEPSVEGTAEL